MKVVLSLKHIVVLIFFVIVATLGLIFISQCILMLSKSDQDWLIYLVTALGNIIGGIIGGIVAYIVATYQVNNALASEKRKQIFMTSAMLKLIREELKLNIATLESAIPYEIKNYILLSTQLTDDIWRNAIKNIVINDRLLAKLSIAYRKLYLIKNINKEDITDILIKDTINQINSTLTLIKEHINEIQKEVNTFDSPMLG